MLTLRHSLLVSLILLTPISNAQVCMKKVTPQTVSAGNFDLSVPGIALNKLSGLIWNRCVYGQTWDNNKSTCIGSPIKLTWQEALQIAYNNNKRLPDIKELNTILDLQCIIPPINLDIFPNTPGSQFNGLWSSTPYITNDTDKTNAWYIDLGFGFANYRKIDVKNFARFINK